MCIDHIMIFDTVSGSATPKTVEKHTLLSVKRPFNCFVGAQRDENIVLFCARQPFIDNFNY